MANLNASLLMAERAGETAEARAADEVRVRGD